MNVTVVLRAPDYAAGYEFGEVAIVRSQGDNLPAALSRAQRLIAEPDENPDDWTVVAAFEGHLDNLCGDY